VAYHTLLETLRELPSKALDPNHVAMLFQVPNFHPKIFYFAFVLLDLFQ
jgi:hypothetical protein